MVAHILRLKLQLLRNSLRRSTAQLIGLVFGGLYGLGVLGAALIGLIALRFALPSDVSRTAITVGGSAVTLGWAIVPLIAFGVDQTLDPARFATFAVPRRKLVLGLLLSSLVGVPGVIMALLGLATVITWSRSVLAVLVAPVAAAVAVLTCVALSRVTSTAFAALSGNRRAKEALGVLGLLVGVGLWIASQTTIMRRLFEPGLLADVGDVLGWTPLGLAWSAPADFVDGAIASGVLRLALAVVFLMVALMAWEYLLRGALENPKATSGGSTTRDTGLGLFGRLPGTPTGAVAARSLTYWRRDPRYVKNAAMPLVMPLIMVLPSLTGSSLGMSLAMAPFAGYLLGFAILHNDVAYDGTAFWTHVATGVSGGADRIGRLMPTVMLASVLLPCYAILGCALSDRWELWPAIFGMGLGFLLAGFGVSSVLSAFKPYPVPGPAESSFSSPPGAAVLSIVVQLVAGAAVLVLNLPVLIFGIWAGQESGWMGWLCLGLAVVLGSAAVLFGTRLGARIYERRAPELLADLSLIR